MNTKKWMEKVTKNFWEQDESVDRWSEKRERFLSGCYDMAYEIIKENKVESELFSLVSDWNMKYPNAEIAMYEKADENDNVIGFGLEDDSFYWEEN